MPCPNQMLLVGGAGRYIDLSDYSLQSVGPILNARAVYYFYADGRLEGVTEKFGGTEVDAFGPWLLAGGNASDYELRLQLLSGAYDLPTSVTPALNAWVAIRDFYIVVKSSIFAPASNSAEFLLEIREKATGKIVGTSSIFLHSDNTIPQGTAVGLAPHTIRGIGSGSGINAAVAGIEIRGDGTSWAYFTDNLTGNQQRVQLENWGYGGANTVMVQKVFNAGKNLDHNSGLGKRLTISAASIYRWSAREPDNEDKVIGLQLDFFNSGSPVYSVRITLDADRRAGAANPGVT